MFKDMNSLKRHISPDVQIMSEPPLVPAKKRRKTVEWTAEERQMAQKMAADHDLLWLKSRATIFLASGREYVDMIGCLAGGGFVTVKGHWEPSADKLWTGAENVFFNTYLQPMLQSGAFEFVVPQVSIYMPGQKISPDFAAFDQAGVCSFYEVKGSYALGSQSRASAKYRWLRYYLDVTSSPHWIYWATLTKLGGDFNVKEVRITDKKHPLLGGK